MSNAMFRGINAVNLDVKGRMAIPARYREQLARDSQSRVVTTIDTEEKCLLLYPYVVWEEIEQKIEALPTFNRVTRRIQRLLIGHATELELDGNGRILLPPLLRDYANLTKQIILVGQGKKFEIWNEKSWSGGRKNWLAEGLNELPELPTELQSLSL
jgi:MraZ protein